MANRAACKSSLYKTSWSDTINTFEINHIKKKNRDGFGAILSLFFLKKIKEPLTITINPLTINFIFFIYYRIPKSSLPVQLDLVAPVSSLKRVAHLLQQSSLYGWYCYLLLFFMHASRSMPIMCTHSLSIPPLAHAGAIQHWPGLWHQCHLQRLQVHAMDAICLHCVCLLFPRTIWKLLHSCLQEQGE